MTLCAFDLRAEIICVCETPGRQISNFWFAVDFPGDSWSSTLYQQGFFPRIFVCVILKDRRYPHFITVKHLESLIQISQKKKKMPCPARTDIITDLE